jgi:hypothetical protein
MAKPKAKRPPGMAEVLLSLFTDDGADVYADFLRDRAHDHDHGFLLSAVRGSNLHPAVKAVLSELIQGKLTRPAYRPVSAETELINMQRAILVLDKEAGGDRRKAAISKTAAELRCGIRTVEKALAEHEEVLKGASSKDLALIRAYRN